MQENEKGGKSVVERGRKGGKSVVESWWINAKPCLIPVLIMSGLLPHPPCSSAALGWNSSDTVLVLSYLLK